MLICCNSGFGLLGFNWLKSHWTFFFVVVVQDFGATTWLISERKNMKKCFLDVSEKLFRVSQLCVTGQLVNVFSLCSLMSENYFYVCVIWYIFEDDYEGDKRNIFGDELLIHTVLLLLNRNQLILNEKKWKNILWW